jgi:Membrane proteins related to metalloendopeptidases
MAWYNYLTAFFAGLFVANSLPHFIHGFKREKYPTPFANSPFKGLSSPSTNMLWALVGHSGNSTGPHLHFQLMDSSVLVSAKGIPCAFEQYELFQNGEWETVYQSVPSNKDRIRLNR